MDRVVVSYHIAARVTKKEGFVVNNGLQLVIPNVISIERPSFSMPADGSLNHRGSLNARVLDVHNKDLESHVDVSLGVFVFNKTALPESDCDKFRSMADIEDGLLYQAKIGNYSILKYAGTTKL